MSKEYPQDSEEGSAYLDEVLATYGITVNPKTVSPSPNTPATGGMQYGVIMIPRSWHGPKSARSNRNGASRGSTNMSGRRNGRPSFRDGRDNTL